MRKAIQRLKNERGLTLVELLAVIVILAIIAVIAFVFIGGIIENSKKDAHIANAQQIISAAKLHEATGGELGSEKSSIKALKENGHLDQVLDPWSKDKYNDEAAYVTKGDDNKGYIINDFKANEASNCKEFTASEKEIADKGRDLCDGKEG